MSNLFTIVRNAPKRVSAVLTMIAAAVIVPTVLLAWGPDRPTYTIENPADHVTFNSITNNPNIGDERNFVGIRESGTNNLWSDNQTVQAGKNYTVRMFVHNNAATSLNASGAGIAHNVTAKFNLPTTTATSIQVNGFLSASNATPVEVYDHAVFSSSQNFNLAYVPGTLKFENNAGSFTLPETAFTSTGAQLGYSSMNGDIPGCFQYSGYVTFEVKPQVAPVTDFTLAKLASKHGANQWVENYQAMPGETVDFVLQYKNTGAVQHDSVTFRDTLPAGLSYVPSSTKWGNARGTNTVTTNDGNLTNGTGINVGSYAPGAAAWTIFSAKVAANDQLPACGANTLTNNGKVNTGGYAVEDTATVTVNKTCAPAKITVCELATKKLITIDETAFDASKHSKNVADCAAPGQITVCDLASKKVINIAESAFDASKHSKNLNDCSVPSELPTTGPAETALSILGLGSLITAASYYVSSRRAFGRQ